MVDHALQAVRQVVTVTAVYLHAEHAVAALEGLHGCAFFGIEVDLHRERFLCVFVASA